MSNCPNCDAPHVSGTIVINYPNGARFKPIHAWTCGAYKLGERIVEVDGGCRIFRLQTRVTELEQENARLQLTPDNAYQSTQTYDEANDALHRVWKELGITTYTGKAVWEHVAELRKQFAAEQSKVAGLEHAIADLTQHRDEIDKQLSEVRMSYKVDHSVKSELPLSVMAGAPWNILDATGMRVAICCDDDAVAGRGGKVWPEVAKEIVALQQRSPTFAEVAAALDGLPSEHWVVLFRNGVCELRSDTTLSVVGYGHLLGRIRNLTPPVLPRPWWTTATLEELHQTALGKGTMVHDCILADSRQAIAELRRRAEAKGEAE